MTTNIDPERTMTRNGYYQILHSAGRYDRQRRKTVNIPTVAPHRHLFILIISVLLHHHNICYSLLINTAKTKRYYFSTLQQPTQRLKIPHRPHHTQPLHTLSATTTTTTSSPQQSPPPLSSWTRPTLTLAIPSLIGMMADPLLSLIDTFFVSQLGPTPLAALGACTSIFHLAFNAFRATTTATTSLVASSDPPSERARFVTRRSLSFGVSGGVLVGVILMGGHAVILKAMNAGGLLFGPARSYLLVRACAAPAVLYCVVSEGAFRGYGDTKVPLVASGVAAGLNLVLDPVLMFGCGMGVGGAALATAVSQVAAMLVYRRFLKRRGMVVKDEVVKKEMMVMKNNANMTTTTTSANNENVIATIIRANLAMMCKQGSLLLAWAYATARATKIGREHVAAHQVALSFWLIFALIMDGAAVAAQVLMSRIYGSPGGGNSNDADDGDSPSSSLNHNTRGTRLSLTKYMALFASLQGVLSSVVVGSLGHFVPGIFSPDPFIRHHLKSLIPILAGQQILISWTLVMESLVAGSQQFRLLAIGTALSTVWSMRVLSKCTDIVGIWRWGIVTLFFGRLLTALVGVARILMGNQRKKIGDSTNTIS